jgi:hypothetical protein
MSSVVNVENAQFSTKLLAGMILINNRIRDPFKKIFDLFKATTLRNVLGTKTLQEILQDREHIAHQIQAILDEATDDWGVRVLFLNFSEIENFKIQMIFICFR